MPSLAGKVALVTGASRGAGRGIALQLGEAGATVYVTGRSQTVEDVAIEVTNRGGHGIPLICDHTVDAQVDAAFERIREGHARLDLLVNNVWGGYEGKGGALPNFWEDPVPWEPMFVRGVRAHLVTSRLAVPLMLRERIASRKFAGVCPRCMLYVWQGEAASPGGGAGWLRHDRDCVAELAAKRAHALIVSTIAWMGGRYIGVYYDVAKGAIVRMAFALASELRPHGIASVALAPGFMRTEKVMEAWNAHHFDLSATESPEYVGRAVVALAADPEVMSKSGSVLSVGALAPEYGFTDVDGKQPPPFEPPADPR